MEITLQKLKNDARQINASIRIGKSGITEGILAELNKKLKDIKLVKIKLLRAALEEIDKKKVGDELAENMINACANNWKLRYFVQKIKSDY